MQALYRYTVYLEGVGTVFHTDNALKAQVEAKACAVKASTERGRARPHSYVFDNSVGEIMEEYDYTRKIKEA